MSFTKIEIPKALFPYELIFCILLELIPCPLAVRKTIFLNVLLSIGLTNCPGN